ncbi:Enamine deaminase RidA, house cleaning of reactive enamine intermediates, YjgF/YER057c/UK114 family [Variovorax sp. HW608]|uniref:RidA family protein n=1 Tax=Variovorax sp. HW608 TaxID=1034889 RepID=UPI00081FAA9C|nr:RidA family protein [Variovorax sp. HW608]SCK20218.1 Enamine deaminase RidA, house cleaning of reactive enamine intermediates, YjgF/YER057c/UK114 family [Variovorax sp. HW608]
MTQQGHDARLKQLGIELPNPVAPAANYIPARKSGSRMYIAGQVPTADGKDQYVGKVGRDVSIEDAQKAARLCAINILAQLRTALGGSLDRVAGCVRLGGFVNATPEFGEHPKVINGASDLMVEVFGDAGRHARAAVGCNSLPRNVAVEVDAIFEIV